MYMAVTAMGSERCSSLRRQYRNDKFSAARLAPISTKRMSCDAWARAYSRTRSHVRPGAEFQAVSRKV